MSALAQTPPLLAVLEFDTPDDALTESELAALTDAMRGAVKKEVGARYKVMTRETMIEIVPVERMRCFAGKCVAEIGRMLQAPYTIAGSARKLGARKLLTVEAYESKGGQLLGSEQFRGSTPEELFDQLDKQARVLVRTWLNLGSGAMAARQAVAETKLGGGNNDFDVGVGEDVVASFESEPTGAIVLMDGQTLCSQTPCSKTVSRGSHQVLMTMEGYDSVEQPFDVSATQRRVSLKLPANFALLSVETTPSGLPVTFDGKPAGTSPIKDKRVNARAHDVMVATPCYTDIGERIVVAKGEKRTVKIEAQPRWAGLRVSAHDDAGNALEAGIEVDGQPMGTTPKAVKLPVCSKEVVVRAPDGTTFRQALSLKEKEIAAINATSFPAASHPAPARGAAQPLTPVMAPHETGSRVVEPPGTRPRFVARAGLGASLGVLGLGLQARLYGPLNVGVGTGSYLAGASIGYAKPEGGLYVDAHAVLLRPGLPVRLLAGLDTLARFPGGVGVGASAGWDLRPRERLSVKLGAGIGFSLDRGFTESLPMILAVDASTGVVF